MKTKRLAKQKVWTVIDGEIINSKLSAVFTKDGVKGSLRDGREVKKNDVDVWQYNPEKGLDNENLS